MLEISLFTLLSFALCFLSIVVAYVCWYTWPQHKVYLPLQLAPFITSIIIATVFYVLGFGRDVQAYPYKMTMIGIYPMMLLKLIFCGDISTFIRCKYQMLVICAIALPMNCGLIGFMVNSLLGLNTNATGIIFSGLALGVISTPDLFIGTDMSRHVSSLLSGESAIGLLFYIILWDLIDLMKEASDDILLEFVLYVLITIVPTFVFGLISGFVATAFFGMLDADADLTIILVVAVPYMVQAFCSLLVTTACVAVLVTCFIMGHGRCSLSDDTDDRVVAFINACASLLEIGFTCIYSGILFLYLIENWSYQCLLYSICAFMIITGSRFIVFLAVSPILSRIECGLQFNTMFLLYWSSQRSCFQLMWANAMLFNMTFSKEYVTCMIHYVLMVVILTNLIHGLTLKAFMRRLNADVFSKTKLNIMRCFTMIIEKRARVLAITRLNRKLTDANWSFVYEKTAIRNPFVEEEGAEYESLLDKNKVSECPVCKLMVVVKPTKKEYRIMKREVCLRVVQVEKVSFIQQYQRGTVTEKAMRSLMNAVEAALNSEEPYMKVDNLLLLFSKKRFAHRVKRFLVYMMSIRVSYKIPNQIIRKACYILVSKSWFDYIFIILSITTGALMLYTAIIPISLGHRMMLPSIAFIIFTAEFVVKLLGFSAISILNGFKIYMKSHWNKFDFVMLFCLLLLFTISLVFVMYKNSYNLSPLSGIQGLRMLTVFKLTRIIMQKLESLVDVWIDNYNAHNYSIGIALVIAYEEVLTMMGHLVHDPDLMSEITKIVNNDRLALNYEMAVLQTNRPWVCNTIKTKETIRAIVKVLHKSVEHLKDSGLTDNYEYKLLFTSMTKCYRMALSRRNIPSVSPRNLFLEISWMTEDEPSADFLFENISCRIWHAGEIVCRKGEIPDGIFIIVAGFFRLTYEPDANLLEAMTFTGTLPVMDVIRTTRFEDSQVEFIMKGDSIGEIAVLTGRPYDCTVTSHSASQAFLIPTAIVHEAIRMSKDPVSGLACRMWKTISYALARTLLIEYYVYRALSHDVIDQKVASAVIPILDAYKVIHVSEMIEETILLEGIVVDEFTREVYIAPCFIPRNVSKIRLMKRSGTPKIFFVPMQGVNHYDMMLKIEESSELISQPSSNMLMATFSKTMGTYKVVQNLYNKKIYNMKHRTTMANVSGHYKLRSKHSMLSVSRISTSTSVASSVEISLSSIERGKSLIRRSRM